MKTKLIIPSVLRKYSEDEIEIVFDGNTVRDLLNKLKRQNPQLHNSICDETECKVIKVTGAFGIITRDLSHMKMFLKKCSVIAKMAMN